MAERTKADGDGAPQEKSAAAALDEAANGSSTPISDARLKTAAAEGPGDEPEAEASADAEASPDTVTPEEPATNVRAGAVPDPEQAKPAVKTAADIVAENEARKAAETEAGKAAAAARAKPATTVAAKPQPAPAPKPAVAAKAGEKAYGKGRTAMSTAGRGVSKARNWIASAVWLIAVVCAAVLALGALFTALDQANESNTIVSWVLNRGHDLVGPFDDVFELKTAKNTLLVNWGIAAVAYLVVGKIAERFIRP